MKTKLVTIIGIATVVFSLLAGVVAAGAISQPSAKATAQVGNLAIATTDGQWKPILTQTIKTPNQKDLLVDVSMEAGLYTQTKVSSKLGTADTSTAQAKIMVRVWVDGALAYPGEIVFADRLQQMTAKFMGIIEDTNGDGFFGTGDTITNEELDLVLKTMNANAFNFVIDDLTAGVHTIKVEAKILTDASWQAGSASATALIGHGSVTVEEVRFTKGEDIELS